uniref:Cytochrome P450 n=1 Tax=Phanerodontia chrysosporium TaxID=2822231 RepID=G5EJM5_PHACH|nr:cytochrome P450 [Phanerodontia chrysosporium]
MGPLQLVLVATAAWALWRLFRHYILRSPLDNIPGPASSSFIYGNLKEMFNRHGWGFHDTIIRQYGPIATVHSMLGARALYVYDPKALNHIILKDQYTYDEPGWFLEWHRMIFGPTLIATTGAHHRKQRKLLNAIFSIARMRDTAPIFYNVAHRLRDAISADLNQGSGEINMIEWFSRAALELAGRGGVAYSFDALEANSENSEFGMTVKQYSPTTIALHFWRILSPYASLYIPRVVRLALGRLVPHKDLQRIQMIAHAISAQSKKIYDFRMAAFQRGDEDAVREISEGRDVLSYIIRAGLNSKEERLPEEEILAHMSGLILGATDTTSNALARTFQLLAEHQDVQDKMRAELADAAPDGEDIPYDQLVHLPLLDAVCRETLRLNPPIGLLAREARDDIVLPFSQPVHGRDGSLINEVPVPKGSTVFISVRACNRNPLIWGEDAAEWKPERWLQPTPKSLSEARVPGVYANQMTFLGGDRACLGFKFSQLEMKVVLAVLLRSFRFLPCNKDVYWNLAGITYPTLGKDSDKLELPIKLEIIGGQY